MDKTILNILSENARLTNEQIADMTGCTPQEVEQTIARLQKSGVIKGFKAIVDWDKTDNELCVALIELKVTPKNDMGFEDIAERVAQFEEVENVFLMSGGYDLSVTVEGKTFKEVATFVSKKLSTLDSVQSTATHFVLKKYKERGINDNKSVDIREVML